MNKYTPYYIFKCIEQYFVYVQQARTLEADNSLTS